MPERVERKAFGEGLFRLNQHTVQMAGLAQQAVRKAVDALIHLNDDEAKQVFQIDKEIFRLQRAVDAECTDLIALYAPVARDLRTVTTVLKISTDIDRIGRGARNIAEVTLELEAFDDLPAARLQKISRNADLAIHMVDQAVRAFVERDDRQVREMGMFDDAVDALYRDIFDDIVAGLRGKSLPPEIGTRLVLVNRHIERIADHAVNISERVVYLVSGEPARHPPKLPPGTALDAPAEPAVPSPPPPPPSAATAPSGPDGPSKRSARE